MLHDVNAFFGDVSPQGAVVLLFVGVLTGFGLHDVVLWTYDSAARWYAAKHDS